jgi:hypothetical protein
MPMAAPVEMLQYNSGIREETRDFTADCRCDGAQKTDRTIHTTCRGLADLTSELSYGICFY